nr:hypothetical protein BACT7_16320 [Tenacibaculum mesophilum]
MSLIDQITKLKQEIKEIESNHSARILELDNELAKLIDESSIAEKNWAGNWFKHTYYYNDFIENSRQHIQLDYNTLLEFTENKALLNYDSIDKELKKLLQTFRNFNDELCTELSIIKSDEKFSEQVNILDKLISFEWQVPSFKIIDSQKPKKFMGDYNTAQKILAKGFDAPPHIVLNANLLSSATLGITLQEYPKLAWRLLREIELLVSKEQPVLIGEDNAISNLNRVFDNFHDVARLLVNRHGNRDTIIINDEYDVQDLLRSLLKIFFDDVRPEDFTPSYAGRNTRIDFLLKKEKIVVEVKKTRETLKDKEVGDELLQDIARYRNHPDCDILYCFVYDPQGFISNPRGLEDDLSSESNEKMTVYVSIKP